MPLTVEINGFPVEFDKPPTPEDVDFAANQLGIAKPGTAALPNLPLPSAPTSPSPLALNTGGTTLADMRAELSAVSPGQRISPLITRTVPAVVGGMVAGLPGAAIGAGVGGTLAQEQEIAGGERESFSLPRLGVDIATSAIPGLKLTKVPAALKPLLRSIQGGLFSAGAGVATNVSEGIPWDENLVRNATLGAGIGGVAGLSEFMRGRAVTQKAAQEATLREAMDGLNPPVTKELSEAPLPSPDDLTQVNIAEAPQAALADTVKQGGAATARVLANTDAAKDGQRLYRRIAEAFENGDIDADAVTRVLERENMSLADFVIHYRQTVSSQGRALQFLSSVQRQLNQLAKGNPALQEAMAGMETQPTLLSRAGNALKTMDNFRRASLVTQIATTSRNIQSQGQRSFLEAVDAAMESTLRGENPMQAAQAGGRVAGGLVRSAADSAGDVLALMRVAKPQQLKQVDRIVEQFPVEAERLLGTPAAEGALGKVGRFLNTLNTMQERYYRRALFDARVRQGLAESGQDVAAAMQNPALIPEPIIREATDFALEGTYAANPKGAMGKGVMAAWNGMRPVATLVNPFPRFFVNAYKFLLDHSPAGYLRLMGMTTERAVMQDPKRMRQVLARAHTGTLLLAGGLAMRNSDRAGEHWWEIKRDDGRTVDARPFAPFSTFLFYGELMKQLAENPDPQALRMTTQDLTQGFLSINRIAGTGLVAVDLLREGSLDRKAQLIGDALSQYMGGFTVPFTTIKDVVAGTSDPEEAVMRDTRTPDFTKSVGGIPVSVAPMMRNVPGLSQKLPPFVSPLKSGKIRQEEPLFRQFTGISRRTKTPTETEVDRLAIESARINPTSGIPELDRLVATGMGPVVEQVLPRLIASPEYQRLKSKPATQRLIVNGALREIRKLALRAAKDARPDLAQAAALKGLDNDLKDILREEGVLPQ